MFFIPGWLVSIITLPGVVVHEAAHKLFCDLAKIKVHQVCYFRIGDPAGFVVHDDPKSLKNAFLISIGPLIVNTLLCMVLTFIPAIYLIFLGGSPLNNIVVFFLAWVGYSVGMHAFPSNEDMNAFLYTVKTTRSKGILYWCSWIFSWMIKIANFLRAGWFDLIYATGISLILPFLLLG